jgi:aspartate aminotransferase-like enzyme
MRKPFFMSDHFEREVASTRTTIESQYRNLNQMGRLDNEKIQRTLNELEIKLQRMVRRMENESNDSFVEWFGLLLMFVMRYNLIDNA